MVSIPRLVTPRRLSLVLLIVYLVYMVYLKDVKEEKEEVRVETVHYRFRGSGSGVLKNTKSGQK